ncbi:MAG: beta-galactosidase [Bacteroidales bacterium]
MKKCFLLTVLLCGVQLLPAQRETMSLSGTWRFQMDPMGFGKTPGSELYKVRLTESIMLPGTTDEGGKGIKSTARHIDRLTRKFEYCGQAWYQREVVIPENWERKNIILNLERCHWETTVYVDGKPAGTEESLSTPNRFDLTALMTPGIHQLTICVDNRLKYPMDQWNHGTSEYTQTNWNGMVGKLELTASEKTGIHSIHAFPDLQNQSVRLNLKLTNQTEGDAAGELRLILREKGGKEVTRKSTPVNLVKGECDRMEELVIGKQVKLWDEFNPNLYEVEATLTVNGIADERVIGFGMRQVEQGKHHIRLNGRDIHLRGALDCCVFPLTGYPATEVADWKRIFTTVKEYGMNHIRFHSWCPPKAAFQAADETGIYLQAELPMWIKDVGKYPARRDFFEKEMYAILEEYGNHPSFILMCNGNENEGDFQVLEDLVKKGRRQDDRRLYSASTARTHTASDQYYVSHVTQKGWITVYEGKPATNWTVDETSDIDCPVIAHETGQRCMYPNFREMSKYSGVVEPRNFEVFRERLARNGMLHQADDFFRASGAHTVLQYKEVNEALLRSRKSGGFQLLGLADFPGQGSAFVGILDAFWESKGLVSAEKFRESCAPSVLLARLPKRTYLAGESFVADLEVYHYGEHAIRGEKLKWSLENETGDILYKGSSSVPVIPPATVDSIGKVDLKLNGVSKASQLTLRATLGSIRNEWQIWVYPRQTESATEENGFILADSWNAQTREWLEAGKNVLLIPKEPKGRKTRFASHFWNPIMFNWDPMIVGTLIQDSHPVFRDFPTKNYADWQWWDILNHAVALDMNRLSGITPLIQCIDSYETNRKLGIAFEAKVGAGNLFVLSLDTEKKMQERLATKQLLETVKSYVGSDRFLPEKQLQPYELDLLFADQSQGGSDTAKGAILQLLNQ